MLEMLYIKMRLCIFKRLFLCYLIFGVTNSVTSSALLADQDANNSTCIDIQTKEAKELRTLETDLIRQLLDNDGYEARQRPVTSPNQTVQVNISLSIFAMTHANEKEKTIGTMMWLTLMWHDYRLTWDPAKYDNLQFLRLDSKDVWTPKIILQNTAPGGSDAPIPSPSSEVLATWDGRMYYEFVGVAQSLCPFKIEKFPFDTQSCLFRFKLQTTPSNLCVLMGTEDNYVINKKPQQFILREKLLVRSYIAPGHVRVPLNLNFSYVEFTLIMERLPMYYLSTVGFPATVITVLSLVSLLLPSNCGEKLSFPVSLFLGLSVFQLIVDDSLPEYNDEPPLLVAYLSITFVMVGSTLFLTVITVTINASRCKITNRRLRLVLLEIPSNLLCANKPKPNESPQIIEDELKENLESNDLKKPDQDTKDSVENRTDVTPLTQEDQITDMELLAKILDRIFFICLVTGYCIGISVLLSKVGDT